MDAALVDALVAVGAVPLVVPVPPPAAAEALAATVAPQLDALLLQGGGDIEPRRWGEAPRDPEWAGDPARDAMEFALLTRMRARARPVLGICRGMQVINVSLGGSLWQDLADSGHQAALHDDPTAYDAHRHPVRLDPHGWLRALYGCAEGAVSSAHHQAVRRLGAGLVPEAWAPDGAIEALRGTTGGWLLGVQWHPEFHLDNATGALPGARLLQALVDAAQR